jgi:hypothetical protein
MGERCGKVVDSPASKEVRNRKFSQIYILKGPMTKLLQLQTLPTQHWDVVRRE